MRKMLSLVRELSACRMFHHVEELSGFGPRHIGSVGDDKQMAYLEAQVESFGARSKRAKFPIAVADETFAELRLLAPSMREIECTANYRSVGTGPGGIATEAVLDVGHGTQEEYKGEASGAIVLAREGEVHPVTKVQIAHREGAAACVWMNQRPGNLIATYGLPQFGSPIPVVSITREDGEFLEALCAKGGMKLFLRVETDLQQGQAEHVIGVVKGSKVPDEIIAVCAHRETVPSTCGANDNASGVAVLLEILRYFSSRPLDRTLWAVFSTGEEGGAIGVREFIKNEEAVTKGVKAAINLDMLGAGTRLSVVSEARWPERSISTSEELNAALKRSSEELGYCLHTHLSTMGLADAGPFIEAGIPATWLRKGEPFYLHTMEDTPARFDANALKAPADILGLALLEIANRQTV